MTQLASSEGFQRRTHPADDRQRKQARLTKDDRLGHPSQVSDREGGPENVLSECAFRFRIELLRRITTARVPDRQPAPKADNPQCGLSANSLLFPKALSTRRSILAEIGCPFDSINELETFAKDLSSIFRKSVARKS